MKYLFRVRSLALFSNSLQSASGWRELFRLFRVGKMVKQTVISLKYTAGAIPEGLNFCLAGIDKVI